MFIQVIKGHVADADELRTMLERWIAEVSPGAIGWLGSTAGVAADGTSIAVVRFESEDAARRNSDRPEQHQWWMETAKLFSGDVAFQDCRESIQMGSGGSDEAGFVQVMQGHVTDVERMKELNDQFASMDTDFRPDVLGGVTALHGDGGYTSAMYFVSEAAAREGEQKQAPAEMKAMMDEEMAIHDGDPTFIDLPDPWLHSPR